MSGAKGMMGAYLLFGNGLAEMSRMGVTRNVYALHRQAYNDYKFAGRRHEGFKMRHVRGEDGGLQGVRRTVSSKAGEPCVLPVAVQDEEV